MFLEKNYSSFMMNEGNHHSIDSGLVNNYIREISEADFTAKDFRTWAGTDPRFSCFKINRML